MARDTLRDAALERLPIFWLLARAAEAMHGRAAVDAELAAVHADAVSLAWEVRPRAGLLSWLGALLLWLVRLVFCGGRGGVAAAAPAVTRNSVARQELPQLVCGSMPTAACLRAAEEYTQHGDARLAWERHAALPSLHNLLLFIWELAWLWLNKHAA
jgi:hypothetical protein